MVVVDYDPAWPGMFERERETIRSALGGLVGGIEHIGSTAVPGLAAKPKIDILVGLHSWNDLDAAVDAVLRLGYEHDSSQLDKPRTFSIKRGRRTTHRVRFVEWNGELWQELLSFRDALRGDPDLAKRYERLKQELASRYRDDPSHEAYMRGKDPFIKALLAELSAEKPGGGVAG